MLNWGMAGCMGSSDIEGVLDQAIETMNQPQQQEKEPSDIEKQGQLQIQLEELRQKGKMASEQMKAQATQQERQFDMEMDARTRQIETQLEMQKQAQEALNEREVIAAKMEADVMTELLTSQINAEQAQAVAETEVYKEIEKAKIKVVGDIAVKREERMTKVMEKQFESYEHDKDLAAQPTETGNDD